MGAARRSLITTTFSNIAQGRPSQGYDSPQVQYWVGRWHQAINNNFYDCSLEIFEALGHMYPEDPQFRAAYEDIHPGLAEFMEQAMTYYCQQAAAKQTPD